MFLLQKLWVHIILSKMAGDMINKIVSQDELGIIFIVETSHETQIKGHYVYKNTWTLELLEHLAVQCETENPVDKYVVYLKTGIGATVGHLKKRESGRFPKFIYFIYEVTLGDGEGL